jgi:hypothetical protein
VFPKTNNGICVRRRVSDPRNMVSMSWREPVESTFRTRDFDGLLRAQSKPKSIDFEFPFGQQFYSPTSQFFHADLSSTW